MTIKIETADWNAIDESEREKIRKIIEDNFAGQSIEAGTGGIKLLGNPACEAACNVAEATAMGACQALPFPANIACAAAAREAGNFCRSRC